MLKTLQKYFKTATDVAPQEEDVNMKTEEQATQAAADNQAEVLAASLASATEAKTALEATVATLESTVAELTAKYETVQAALTASEDAQKVLATQAAEKRLTERTEAIKAAVGTDKVEALLAATDGMADEQFNVIVSAMAASFDAEAETEMFQEAGMAAETVVDEKPTHFNKFIK